MGFIEGLTGRAMLNLNGRSHPAGFALKMLEHFCRIWVKLFTDEGLQWIWREGKSHAEPQRLIWSRGLRVEDALSFLFPFFFGTEDG